jgi:glycosyltransferase involved in cell wall biosynthesis
VAIITKDEAAHIQACLASVAFARDVVVVDAKSDDGTAILARQAGARVFVREWPGFTLQRNFSLKQCRYDWVLSVDADERVSLDLAVALAAALAQGPQGQAYRIPELNCYFGRWLRHGGIYPGHHVSFFDRRRLSYGSKSGDVHEDVSVKQSGLLDGHMLHLAYPSFQLALQKLNRYTDLEARGRYGRGDRACALDLLRRPMGRFINNFVLKQGFRDGIPGFLYCCLTALYAFSFTVKIWELQQAAARQAAPAPSKARQRRSNSAAPANSSVPSL